MGRKGKLVKNTVQLGLGTVLPKLASLITLPILTGYLTKAEYGTYDLITVLVSLYLPAVTVQIQTAAFRFLVENRENKQELNAIISNLFGFVIPTSLFGLVVLWFLVPDISPKTRAAVCIYYFADILVNALRQVARGLERNDVYSASVAICSIGTMIFAVFLVFNRGMGLEGAVYALAISSILALIILVWQLKLFRYIAVHSINRAKLCTMLAYSWPMVPNCISMWVMRLSDRLVVTAVMGVSANAVYAVANKFPNLLNLAQSAFTMAWQENASLAQKDSDTKEYYASMFSTMLSLTAGFFGLLIAVSPILFRLFVRGDYSEAFPQMIVLFGSAFFYSMATFLGGIYIAYKKTKSVGITTTAAALCNLVVDILLVRKIGLYAASLSTLVSYLLLFLFRMVDIRRFVYIPYDYFRLGAIALILSVECFLCLMRGTLFIAVNVVVASLAFYYLNKKSIHSVVRNSLKFFERDISTKEF